MKKETIIVFGMAAIGVVDCVIKIKRYIDARRQLDQSRKTLERLNKFEETMKQIEKENFEDDEFVKHCRRLINTTDRLCSDAYYEMSDAIDSAVKDMP